MLQRRLVQRNEERLSDSLIFRNAAQDAEPCLYCGVRANRGRSPLCSLSQLSVTGRQRPLTLIQEPRVSVVDLNSPNI